MEIKKEAIILRDIKTVFNIVNNVNLYKNFVPYCVESKILLHSKNQMEAKLDFNIKGFNISFTTRNNIFEYSSIEMKLVDGPLKYLDGNWQFREIEDKTIICLQLNYEVKNRVLDYAIGKYLGKIIDSLVKSFVNESMK